MSVWGTVHIIISLEAFPGSRASTTSLPWELVSCLGLRIPDLPKIPAYTLSLGQPTPSLPSLLRPSITDYISTGILTRFPSTTHFCLALGPTYPALISMGQETLVFRRGSFSLPLSLLMSAFALVICPASFTTHLHPLTQRSPTQHVNMLPQLRYIA